MQTNKVTESSEKPNGPVYWLTISKKNTTRWSRFHILVVEIIGRQRRLSSYVSHTSSSGMYIAKAETVIIALVLTRARTTATLNYESCVEMSSIYSIR